MHWWQIFARAPKSSELIELASGFIYLGVSTTTEREEILLDRLGLVLINENKRWGIIICGPEGQGAVSHALEGVRDV